MAYNLYLLPLSLKHCELVDTTDTRYLHQIHTPLVSPLMNTLYIKLYNDK